jgi:hypothetical protein
MSHHEHTHHEEKKSVNFWGPVIGGIVVWLIILIIETNLDEPKIYTAITLLFIQNK